MGDREPRRSILKDFKVRVSNRIRLLDTVKRRKLIRSLVINKGTVYQDLSPIMTRSA